MDIFFIKIFLFNLGAFNNLYFDFSSLSFFFENIKFNFLGNGSEITICFFTFIYLSNFFASISKNFFGFAQFVFTDTDFPDLAAFIIEVIISNTCKDISPLHKCFLLFSIEYAISDNQAPR